MLRVFRPILLFGLLLATPVLVFAQDGGLIEFGQVVTGEITNATPEIRYQFEGAADEVISISMTATEPGLDSFLNLLDPDGQNIFSDDDSGGNLNSLLGPFTLPVDGSYTIVATRCCGGGGGSVGPFELVLNRAELIPLAAGETVRVDLSNEQPHAAFSVLSDAATGRVFRLVGNPIEGDAGFFINVRDPQGMFVNQGASFDGGQALVDPLFLSAGSRYLISVTRAGNPMTGQGAAAPVSLSLTVEAAQSQALVAGVPASGVLTDDNPSDYYTFEASRADLLRLVGAHLPGDQPVDAQLFGPEGFAFNGGNTAFGPVAGQFTLDPLQIFEDGEFLIVLRRFDPDGSGIQNETNYTIRLSESKAPTLASGVEVTGTVGAQTFEQVYRYEGTAGVTVRIALRSLTDSYAPGLNVQGPNLDADAQFAGGGGGMGGGGMGGRGSSFFVGINGSFPASATYEVTLPDSGVYLFSVSNGAFNPDGPQAGDFGLTVTVIE